MLHGYDVNKMHHTANTTFIKMKAHVTCDLIPLKDTLKSFSCPIFVLLV